MRKEKTLKNTVYGFGLQFVILLVNFISRTFFIKYLGVEYLGISGLFSSILSMLSLSELGLGTAILYSLYKPLADNDILGIKQLMNFFAWSYRLIAVTVFGFGLCLLPFLSTLVKTQMNIDSLSYIYVLFLMNSSLSYLFSFKRSLITASQNEYINSKNEAIFVLIQNFLNIVVLIVTKNYLFYLGINIIVTVLKNINISHIADKLFPFIINNEEKLPKEKKKILFKYVLAQMSHKIGGVVVNGTDNLLISLFVGISSVGYYSNYLLIVNTLKSFISIFFNSAAASIGNLNASVEKEYSQNIYYNLLFANFMLFCSSGILFYFLANDFISIWIGSQFVLSSSIILLIAINYFLSGIRLTTILYNTSMGLFWNDRFKPFFESIINLVASIILLRIYGFSGVLLGTTISTISTSFWVEPYILFKHGFRVSVISYFNKFFKYLSFYLLLGIIQYYLFYNYMPVATIWQWIVKAILSTVYLLTGIVIVFWRNSEFIYIKSFVLDLLRKK